MSKKPAELSANLVAVKGAAMPAADMPARAAPQSASLPASNEGGAGQGAKAGAARGKEALAPLNFRISATFRREFKTYAANHDLKLNELLRLCFDAYRKAN